ncbi:MFS general substrate transporter [Mollisia scopiformis]|uniref:MFS general substrate transporter n=1 Tax=Mollisia scopiformis TaxID=149040 RepID=A0A194X0C0_MOLSC|nr:MFS general substrate transporter [Mollisia scopiformis]KUJ13317.1 MFS general substrate transporter [Mollisia scopiformis]
MDNDPISPESQQILAHQATLDRLASRQQYDDTFDGIDLVDGTRVDNNSNSTLSSDKDLEKGDEQGTAAPPLHQHASHKQRDPNLIEWDGPNDPENPMNWTVKKKWITTIALGFMTFCVTFASSVFSNATVDVAELYHVSTEVSTLGTSLFVFGFAVGPLIWGPGSEIFGRKLPLFFGYFCFAIFQIPIAVAQNLYTIMLCRFFGGAFASAPLAIVGGALADFWGPVDRGIAVCVFACATFIGPIAGPIMGGFITQSYLGWRWTAWITLIMAAFFGTVGFFLVPESSHSKVLQDRATKIRFETQNWAVHSQRDTIPVDITSIIHTYLFKPFKMLAQEPILLLVTIYMSLIYGILYLFFEAYPISFQEQRGWNQGVGALPFLGIMIGVLFGAITISIVTKTRFARKLKKHGRVIPEERLPPMILGAVLLPIGLFWFAWTSSPHITWVPQVLAGIPIGWGILMVFLQGLNYIIDVYMWNANSAIAANTFLRSFAGGGFPLFATAMYHNLGVAWATSLLGFLCIAMIPAPIAFYFYGAKIRAMSKFSPSLPPFGGK